MIYQVERLKLARAECPECSSLGPHEDNGADNIQDLALLCKDCGMQFDAPQYEAQERIPAKVGHRFDGRVLLSGTDNDKKVYREGGGWTSDRLYVRFDGDGTAEGQFTWIVADVE